MAEKLYILGGILIALAVVIIGVGKFSYRFRAFRNKKAWDGSTLPFLIIGLVFLIIGSILFYVYYPYK